MQNTRAFATKKDKKEESKSSEAKEELSSTDKVKKTKKTEKAEGGEGSQPVKRKRRTKAEIEADRLAKLSSTEAKPIDEAGASESSAPKKRGRKSKVQAPESQTMYTLKFNSPILPFSKFPLTQNKYIQDFLRGYEEQKDKIEKVIGVHFEKNNNVNAQNAVGIEIEIIKKNNITVIESSSR